MRKLLGLLMLVPFAAILVLSCDEHPTAPENAQAATTVQESSTPQATKAPRLPTPVALSGYTVQVSPVLAICPSGSDNCCAGNMCPAGKVLIAGGFETNTPDFVLTRERPFFQPISNQVGWAVCVTNTSSGSLELGVSVACTDGVVESD
jgi:hypothetical protein